MLPVRASVALTVLLLLGTQLRAAAPFYDPVFGFSKTSDIVYGTGPITNPNSTFNLALDLYQPADIGTPLPAIAPGLVMIHGGSFTSMNKNEDYMNFLCSTYATYGYTVVSIDYRLLGQAPPTEPGPAGNLQPTPPAVLANEINAAISDSKKAMVWMRDNAATYHIDPNKIGIGGVSAGAITALLEAYNNPPAASAPKVVLDFLGSMYGTEGTIHAGAPPAFIVHGTADPTVPFSGDQAVANRLAAVGVYREFYPQAGLGHTFDPNAVTNGETLMQHNLDFLRNQLLVPEPATWLLAAMGLLALVLVARLRRA